MTEDMKDTSSAAAEASLMALLTGAGADEAEEIEERAEGDEQDERPEGDESDEAEEEDAESEEDEDAEGEEDEEDEDEKKPRTVPDDAVIFTVANDGKSIPVTKGEARKGFMLNLDYSRKTAELAQARTAVQGERQELTKALAQVLAAMDGADTEATPEKLAAMAREHPQEAMRLRLEREARDDQRTKIKAAQAELDKRTRDEQVAAAAERQKAEFTQLMDVMPELDATKDEKKSRDVLTDLTKAAVAAGFSESDMNGITDHRLMVLLKLAAQGLRLGGKKSPTPQPKGEQVPALKPGVRVPGQSSRRQAERTAKAKQSHSVDDAVEALLGDIEGTARKRRSS